VDLAILYQNTTHPEQSYHHAFTLLLFHKNARAVWRIKKTVKPPSTIILIINMKSQWYGMV